MSYQEFMALEAGAKITLKQVRDIYGDEYETASTTIKADNARGAETVYASEVKVGDWINNSMRFIEVVEEQEAEQAEKADPEVPAVEIVAEPEPPKWYGKPGKEPKTFFNAYRFARWAWTLCTHNGEQATRERYEKALTLLTAVNRYACADARQWEAANSSERYCNSKQCEQDEKALDKRRANINKRLAEFAAHLESFGLYPSICNADNTTICFYSNN
jgi:hypothetical protein